MTTIRFNSLPSIYQKEKSGIKPNTVRFTNDWDQERWNAFEKAKFVIIKNKHTKESFKRRIEDKTIFSNLVIISWRHESFNHH